MTTTTDKLAEMYQRAKKLGEGNQLDAYQLALRDLGRAYLAAAPASEKKPLTEEQECEAFEAWAQTANMGTERWNLNPDIYDSEDTISAWEGWKAHAGITPKERT